VAEVIAVLAALIGLAIIAAVITVEIANLLFAVISIGAVGFLLAIAFLLLGAPDVAIVQIGVEVLSLVILVRATIGRDVQSIVINRALAGTVAGVILVVGIALFALRAFNYFPPFGYSVMQRIAEAPSNVYLQDGLAGTGAPNIVTAVLLDFRGYDTLGEATVLFCAVLGAVTILRRKARSGSGDRPD
jgi:multicomponent Na+:H+ antiporter subunit B